MKLNSTKLRRMINNRPKNSEAQLHRKAIYVFPFKLVTGITNLTEAGERNWMSKVEDYTSFVCVLNGKENAIAVWEGSTLAKKDNKSEISPLNGFIGTYQIGIYFNGYVQMDNAATSISPLIGDEQFKTIKHSQDITITFGYDSYKKYNWVWDPENEDLYKLYIIPELFGNQWMRISNVSRFYKVKGEQKKIDRVDVTFSTISDELSDTGGIKRQFINASAPGEGYAWPSIDENRNITLDVERLRDRPITSFQIRTDGASAPSSIYFMGRPCFNDTTNFDGISEKRILPPRRIIAYQTTGAITPKISLTGTATDNYFYSAKTEMVLSEVYDSWKSKIGDTYNLLQSQNFEGGLHLGETLDIQKVEATNDASKTATKLYPNNVKDNPLIQVIADYDAGASPFVEINREDGKFKLNGYYTYAELLNHNAFINDQVIRQRNTLKNVTTWSISKVPIIGGFLNMAMLGADYGWNNVKTILPTPAFGIWFACELLDLVKITGSNDVNAIACDVFRQGTDSDLNQKAGIGNLSTAFRIYLTDLYYNDPDPSIKETIYLAQKKDENNNQISPVQLWKPTSKPQYRGALDNTRGQCFGYILDYLNVKMEYSGDYTITFFNDDIQEEPIPVAEWRLISKGKSSGSIREWNNDMRLSFWEPNFTTEGTFNWPEAIDFPPPISAEIKKDIPIYLDNFGGNTTGLISIYTSKTGLYDNLDDWDPLSYPFTNNKALYWYTDVNANWRGWPLMKKIITTTSIGYFKQQGPYNNNINIPAQNVINMFNSIVEEGALISTIPELRRSFKRVKIGIKQDWLGDDVIYRSTAINNSYIEFIMDIDQFIGNFSGAKEWDQHVTSMRSKTLGLDVVVPHRFQSGFKTHTILNLSVNAGNINVSINSYHLGHKRIYQVGDTDFELANNNRTYKYKIDKIEFMKK